MANRFAGKGDYLRDTGSQKWINVFGDVQVIRNIERLRTAMQRKILRKAIAKGLKPIADQAKRNAPEKIGLLKRSIKSKVTRMVSGKIYVDPKVIGVKSTSTGGRWAKVSIKAEKGADKGYRAVRKAIVSQNPDANIKKPANYAHLVEFGTRHAQAHPFMRPAMEAGRKSALSEIEKEAKIGLAKEAAKK